MAVILRYSETLNLTFVECTGVVTTAQLASLARCAAENMAFLKADSLNLVHADADLSSVDLQALAAHFAQYQKLYAPLQFQIYRRTAWVCHSPSAEAQVDFWVLGNASRKAFSTNTRRLNTLAEAADWLLLNQAELAMIETGEGFVEFAVFEDAPPRRAVAG